MLGEAPRDALSWTVGVLLRRRRTVGPIVTEPRSLAGLQLFARYAYAPNQLGYCGPGDDRALFDYGVHGVADAGLVELVRGFTGPWPYLTLVAGAAGIDDPFDVRVVEAYWLGNGLLEGVDTSSFGRTMEDYFRPLAGRRFGFLEEAIPVGAAAHHGFHVFGVYPWVGILQSGRTEGVPLRQLDQCRIRWGQVVAIHGDEATVRSQPLAWDGTRLSLGPWQTETVTRGLDGTGFVDDLAAGDWVSMHWHWICDRLDRRQLRNLRHYTVRQLHVTNDRVAHSGPGVLLSGG